MGRLDDQTAFITGRIQNRPGMITNATIPAEGGLTSARPSGDHCGPVETAR